MLRRNFTLRPFGDFSPALNIFFTEPLKEANSSFLAPEIEKLLETPAGNYKGFQTAFEAFEVRRKVTDYWTPNPCVASGRTQLRTLDHGRVSCSRSQVT